jgi:hypothetical protein
LEWICVGQKLTDIPAHYKTVLGGFGTSTSGLVGGGKAPTDSVTNNAATWDGTNWTDVAELGQSRAGQVLDTLEHHLVMVY